MQVLKERFVELTRDKERSTLLDNIYIKVADGGFRSLSSLYIKVKDALPVNQVRKITSLADFRAEMEKNNVFFNDSATDVVLADDAMHEPTLYVDKIEIPNTYNTVRLNQTEPKSSKTKRSKKTGKKSVEGTDKTAAQNGTQIPYGLKRTLEVRSLPMFGTPRPSTAGESPRINSNVKYIYAKAENGAWDFYDLDDLKYFEGKVEKSLRQALLGGVDISNIIVFDANGDPLSQIYTEQGFYFNRTIAQESLDVEEMKKTTYSIEHDGSVVYKTEDVPQKYSMQRYVTKEEQVGNSDKTEQVSYVRTKNYHANEQGNYLAISVNGSVYMIHKDEVLDKDGNPITFIDEKGELIADSIKLGEPVYFMQNGELKASDPVTYEQLMIRYETYKSYHPTTEKVATEETYLRIEDCASDPDLKGRYIKELESVQPICYTVVGDNETDFDKYFVKLTGGSGQWVCVDKEFFEKNKAKNTFDIQTYKKVKRCDYNSSKCHIMQTTSGDAKVENCVIISEALASEFGETVADKKEHFANFINDYKAGKYQVKDLYLNGQLVTLAPDQTRYLYTDEAEYRDYANDTARFRAYNNGALSEKDGKLKGGPKFKMGKALKKRYEKTTELLGNACKIFLIGGFVFPPLYPVFLAGVVGIAGLGYVGSALFTMVEGAIKNTANAIPLLSKKIKADVNKYLAKKATDKVEYNRKKEEKAIKRELRELYKNRSKLSDLQFNDAMATLKHRIDNFAQTGSTSSVRVVNGKIQGNGHNAGLVIGYKKAINAVNKDIKGVEASIKKCLKKDGKTVKPLQEKRYDQLTKRLTELKARREDITNQTLTSPGAKADKRGERLERVSDHLRLHRNIEKLNDAQLVVTQGEEVVTLKADTVKVLKRCKWTAEKGLEPTLMDRIFHRQDMQAIQAAMPAIQKSYAGKFKVEKPLSEQVEVKQGKLDAGREILDQRTASLDASKEKLTEVADGYVSAAESKRLIAGAEQEIARDHKLLDAKFTVEQIDEHVQKIEGHTKKTETATTVTGAYVSTVEQIKGEHETYCQRVERITSNGVPIDNHNPQEVEDSMAKLPTLNNDGELEDTLKNLQSNNSRIEPLDSVISQIRQVQTELHTNTQRKRELGTDMPEVGERAVDGFIEETLHGDYPDETSRIEAYNKVLQGLQRMNGNLAASLPKEAEADVEAGQTAEEVVEDQSVVEGEEVAAEPIEAEAGVAAAPAEAAPTEPSAEEVEEQTARKAAVKRKKTLKEVADEQVQADEDTFTV